MKRDRVEMIVPVDVSADMDAGTILEYDSTNHYYTAYSSGTPVAVLLEDVTAGQSPATAKVLFEGEIDEDDLASTPNEDVKAALRNVGIYVISTTNVNY